jgi:hypothetical protein
MITDVQLKDMGRMETHKKYIDIQYIVRGSEIVSVDLIVAPFDSKHLGGFLFYDLIYIIVIEKEPIIIIG